MIIVDQEARGILEQLCDIALRSGGLRNLQPITKVLSSIEDFPSPKGDVSSEDSPNLES